MPPGRSTAHEPRYPAVRHRVLRRAAVVVGAAGLVTVLAGTFLPWVVSGGILRNSYVIAGIVGRLGLLGSGFGATAVSWWPFLGPVAMVAVIAAIVRLWRTAAVIAMVFGVLTGLIGGGALALSGRSAGAGVSISSTGPVVTLIGAIASVVAAIIVLVGSRMRLGASFGPTVVLHPGQNRHTVEPVESAESVESVSGRINHE